MESVALTRYVSFLCVFEFGTNSDAAFGSSWIMSRQDSNSTFDSVVVPLEYLPWQKHPSNSPLTQLHVKFWGKTMADEERDWRNAQPPIGGEIDVEDQCGDERMDEDGDDIGGDEGERTDVEDDFIPGCYALDINIEGIECSKIWIRADYIRIYDYLKIRYTTPSYPPGRAPAAVLTGQPGIGKCPTVTS
jgi:hypothetical protein